MNFKVNKSIISILFAFPSSVFALDPAFYLYNFILVWLNIDNYPFSADH